MLLCSGSTKIVLIIFAWVFSHCRHAGKTQKLGIWLLEIFTYHFGGGRDITWSLDWKCGIIVVIIKRPCMEQVHTCRNISCSNTSMPYVFSAHLEALPSPNLHANQSTSSQKNMRGTSFLILVRGGNIIPCQVLMVTWYPEPAHLAFHQSTTQFAVTYLFDTYVI